MRYLGGKSRVGKHLAPFLARELDRLGGVLHEPFVGGFNIVPAVYNHIQVAYCSDVHPALCSMYEALKDGWDPPDHLDREEWSRIRREDDPSNPLTAFAAFGCSFGGREWGSYARDRQGTNYAAQTAMSLRRKREFMDVCTFSTSSYNDLAIESGLVYCDPPYRGVAGYKMAFNNDEFESWCEQLSEIDGVTVLVSEFNAPRHWTKLWQRERKTTSAIGKGRTVTEKLFKVRRSPS